MRETHDLSPERLTDLGEDVDHLIKFEADLSAEFGRTIALAAHGEKAFPCIQCGTCSATCPVSHYFDYTPRRIIAMIRAGFKEEVLRSFSIWLCASCHSCTAECPREIKITDIMYALKQQAIKEGFYPKRFPIPVMAKEFNKIVDKKGRNNEGKLMVNLAMRTNPFSLFRYSRVGLGLLRRGRVTLRDESIKNPEELQRMLRAVERAKEAQK